MRRRRRLPRILLNAATAVSLVLFAATIAMWVRSHWATDDFNHWSTDQTWWARVDFPRGCVHAWLARCRHVGERTLIEHWPPGDFDPADGAFLGFEFWRWGRLGLARQTPLPLSETGWEVVVPDWLLAGAFAALPIARLVRHRRRRRRLGLCPACGYDLRATPERCPECGAVPPPPHRR